jgi:nitrite reductase/ring-hydroxylating ferredoxin subunit
MTGAAEPPAWTRVGSLSDFKSGRQLACRIGDLELLLLRVGSDVVVLHNYCTHLGKPLTGGRVMAGQIACPFHGACFDVKTGVAVSGPAVFPLHRFPARLEGDEVVADLSRKPLNPAAAFGKIS